MIKTVRTLAVAALMGVVATADLSHAQDAPVSAVKLKLRRSTSGTEKLVFVSKADPFVNMELFADPSVTGVTIDLFSQAATEIATLTIPSGGGWTQTPGESYRFRNPDAPAGASPVKSFSLRKGHGLKIVAAETGLALTGTNGPVGIRLTLYDSRFCAHFDATTIRQDKPGSFSATNALSTALADCLDGSVAGILATCGDHILGTGEQCDGVCTAGGQGPFGCVIPGAPNECTCCSNSYPQALPCCQPSLVYYVPNSKICIPNSCEPPFECSPGDECLPDNTCCNGLGQICGTQQFTDLPCCPGTICDRVVTNGSLLGVECCVASGDGCTNNSDCCTSVCQLDGTCAACTPAGAACGVNTPCCSGTCNFSTFVCDP
jgi:hypothetical protein